MALINDHDLEMLETKRITDEMPGGFFIYCADESEEIIYANKALLRMFNCETMEEFKEWTGNSFRGIVHPDDLEAVEESIKQQIAVSKYDLDYVEYRIIQKGGEIRWIEDYGHFIHSEFAGDVFYVFVGDATEKYIRQQEEKAAILHEKEQEEQKFQSQIDAYDKKLEVINQEQLRRLELIEGLSIDYESIFYIDIDADLFQPYQISERTSDSFQSGLEYRFCEFVELASDFAVKWVHPEDQELFLCAVAPEYMKEQLSGRKVYHVNYRIIKDEKVEYMQLCVINVGNMKNGSQVVIGCRNINDVVRHEIEQNKILEDAMSHAKKSGMVKDIFLANMSHDIRTPMNAIIGFTALAKAHMGDMGKLINYLEKIEASGNQLIQLLDDVLELSGLESNKIRLEETECDLRDVLKNIEAVILPQMELKELKYSLDQSKLAHPEVYSDREHLTQILLRIIGNAVKYTENGGSINVSVIERNVANGFMTCQFVVEDTGISINESFLEHIFEPFERQKNTTLSGVQGIGIGLTIVKNIVEMMGGTIEASSISGQGSRFTVTLSFKLQNKYSEPEEVLPGDDADCPATGKVLVVEDNEINLEIVAELLADAGYLVDTAVNGSIAVDKVKNSRPGDYFLILMDIQMPVMDGYSATRAIRKLENISLANIPIVALSANALEEDQRRSMESGMNGHMAKPVHVPELLGLVEDMAGRAKAY